MSYGLRYSTGLIEGPGIQEESQLGWGLPVEMWDTALLAMCVGSKGQVMVALISTATCPAVMSRSSPGIGVSLTASE